MRIEDWPSARSLSPLYRELKQLDLLEHVAELEAFGFTVLPPDVVGPPEQHEAVRSALIKVACERKKCTETELPDLFRDGQELMRFMLWDDPVFEEIIVHPAALGLIQYLLGTNCILSLCDGWLKGTGESSTGIHCDWAQFEMPTFSARALHRQLQLPAVRLQQGRRCPGVRTRQPPLAALAVARGGRVLE